MPARNDAATLFGLLAFLITAFLVLAAVGPASAIGSGIVPKLLFLGRMALLIAFATLLLRRGGRQWVDVGLGRPRWLRFVIAIPIGYLFTALLVGAAQLLLARAGIAGPDYSMFKAIRGDAAAYAFWALPVALGSAGLGEELVFRGYVRGTIEALFNNRSGSEWVAIGVQAALFGVLHAYQGLGGILIATAGGLSLGLIWRFSGRNLWAPIVVHFLIDFGSVTAIYLGLGPR